MEYRVTEVVANFAKTITVTVRWTDRNDHSIALKTLVAKKS